MRQTLRIAAGLLCASLAWSAAAADPYPSQPVRLVIGYAPGGSTDVFARALAQKLGERWKKEVYVDNKPGASEIIGATAVANAKPDGHTLLVATDQALLSNPFLFSKLTYDPNKSFVPVVRAVSSPMLLLVRANSPYKNVSELVETAKREPGKITYSSNGPGAHMHQALNWLGVKGGAKFTHVPYKGGGPAIQAVLAGEVDMTTVPLAVAESFLKANTLRALAVTSPKRIPVLPEVPSLAELGYDVDVQALVSIVAPAGTPAVIVNKISDDVRAIVNDPAFAAAEINRYGYFVIGDTPKQFADYLAQAASVYRARISAADVKLD